MTLKCRIFRQPNFVAPPKNELTLFCPRHVDRWTRHTGCLMCVVKPYSTTVTRTTPRAWRYHNVWIIFYALPVILVARTNILLLLFGLQKKQQALCILYCINCVWEANLLYAQYFEAWYMSPRDPTRPLTKSLFGLCQSSRSFNTTWQNIENWIGAYFLIQLIQSLK